MQAGGKEIISTDRGMKTPGQNGAAGAGTKERKLKRKKGTVVSDAANEAGVRKTKNQPSDSTVISY